MIRSLTLVALLALTSVMSGCVSGNKTPVASPETTLTGHASAFENATGSVGDVASDNEVVTSMPVVVTTSMPVELKALSDEVQQLKQQAGDKSIVIGTLKVDGLTLMLVLLLGGPTIVGIVTVGLKMYSKTKRITAVNQALTSYLEDAQLTEAQKTELTLKAARRGVAKDLHDEVLRTHRS